MDEAALLAELYEEAPCGYLSTDPGGTVTKVNQTFEQMTGRPRDELMGMRFSDLLTPGGRIYHETHFHPLLQMQGEVREIALELERADGGALPVLLNSVVRKDTVLITVFDASERRGYELELLSERRRANKLERRASFLADAGRALGEVRGVSDRAQRMADLLVPETVDTVVVVLAEPRSTVASAGEDAHDPELQDLIDAALQTGLVRRTAAAAGVPMRIGERVTGALGVTRTRHVDGLTDEDVSLLEQLTGRAALALENARLYEYEHQVAATLQRSMLAGDPPRDARCAIGTFYSPGVETLEVGGDWHDAFCVDDDRMGLVVGDVVGRGLEAAIMMGQLRSAVRALAAAGLGPAGVLSALDAFVEQTGDSLGATVAYAEVDLASGRLTFACAGHPPPVLAPAGHAPELVWGGRSAPLGAYVDGAARAEHELLLEPGARLLLYTDGLVERRNEALDAGLDRLVDAVRRADGTDVSELGARLSEELLVAGRAADDVCVLAFAFHGG